MSDEIVEGKSELITGPVNASATRDFIFETLIDATINTSTASKYVNVGGFRKFSLMARFEGTASA